jgi:AcrR family transcriptional regulator
MGRKKNFSREGVLDKAVEVFWQHGYADTSLQDLELATGVNKSGLYSEFKDKEDLFLATLGHYLDGQQGQDWLTAKPLGWGNIERFLTLACSTAPELPGCYCVNSIREMAILPDRASDIIGTAQARLKQQFSDNLAAETTSMPPEELAEMVLVFYFGVCLDQNNASASPEGTARKIANFMRMLRGC